MKKKEGLRIARDLKKQLLQKGYPVQQLYLFGSVARGQTHKHSDIDIAIVCPPFRESRHRENARFLLESKDVDLRIQTVCLRPEDFDNRYWALPQEVKKYGIEV